MRMTITLSEQERQALKQMAQNEMRPPRDQVRFVLRQELERRGLLPEREPVPAGGNHDERS